MHMQIRTRAIELTDSTRQAVYRTRDRIMGRLAKKVRRATVTLGQDEIGGEEHGHRCELKLRTQEGGRLLLVVRGRSLEAAVAGAFKRARAELARRQVAAHALLGRITPARSTSGATA